MAKTKNLNLELTEDPNMMFKDWREVINGNRPTNLKSNAQIVDEFAGETKRSIQTINQSITDANTAIDETKTLAEKAYGQSGTISITPTAWQELSYTIAIAELKASDAIFLTPATDSDNEKLIQARISATVIEGSLTLTIVNILEENVSLNYFISKGAGDATAPVCYLNVQNKNSSAGNVQADSTIVNILPEEWVENSVIKTVENINIDSIIIVSPAPESYSTFCDSRIRATEQGDGTITFVCEEKPTETITINLVIMPGYPKE